ncbi:electron transfer flavoprotein-ubiquinone oxidoreductase, partial [Burkholderia mallei]
MRQAFYFADNTVPNKSILMVRGAFMTPASPIEQYGTRESLEYDVVMLGGRPHGMPAAIRP